jgi:hypothetical protein
VLLILNPTGKENRDMTRKRGMFLAFVTAFLLLGMCAAISPAAEEAPRITKEKLKEMMGNPELVILDVRFGMDWGGSKEKIKGAIREDPMKRTKDWADKYGKDKTIVLYCA